MVIAKEMNDWNKFKVTNVAEFAFEAASAEAFAAGTFAVAGAIRHFAFVVFQTTFAAFPAWIALALAVDVVAPYAAQYRAHTLKKTQSSRFYI